MLKNLVIQNRSYRRFYEEEPIALKQVLEWLDLARLGASARNAQSIKYQIVLSEEKRKEVFSTLAWAGYLKDWKGPEPGERPAAYVVMLNDEDITTNYFCDDGIAAQNLLLGAVESGYGGCIIRAFLNSELRTILKLEDKYKIIQVIALGKPKEKVLIEEIQDNDIRYWRDNKQVHHVPKRKLCNLILSEL